ncbi:MAG: YkgJ family cysteine cluster protein [Spirochaetales bacterium]|nr:YkgJ family cysteine cluster protein [Spirochaetales bacterium]
MIKKVKIWWESICLGCGQCCCEKIPVKLLRKSKRRRAGNLAVNRRYVIDFSSPCCYLDIERGDCLIYEQRFKVCKSCVPMTIFHAFFADYLPPDCGYVKKFRFWRKK